MGIAMDAAGNLYGTLQVDGPAGWGAVFKIAYGQGGETTLSALTGGVSGNSPQSNLVRDTAGNVYGSTYYGGPSNNGVIYKIDAAGHQKALYQLRRRFLIARTRSEISPSMRQVIFYGTTSPGQTGLGDEFGPPAGGGVIFKVDSSGHETTLYNLWTYP